MGLAPTAAAAPESTAATTDRFLDCISRPGPLTVQVSGTITLPTGFTDGMHPVASDKTIVGLGGSARITGGGLHIGLPVSDSVTSPPANAVHNVIVRNLTFRDAGDDSINVQMFAHRVWIDHNDLSAGYDGLLDIKHGSGHITVSWNHTHHHAKNMLLGHSDSNGAQDTGRLNSGPDGAIVERNNVFVGDTVDDPQSVKDAVVHGAGPGTIGL